MSKKNKSGGVVVTENGDAIYTPGATVEESTPDGAPVGSGTTQPNAPRDKAESFVRLAERRTARAIKDVRALIPLANRSAYEYTDSDGAAIVSAIQEALADLQRAFSGQKQQRPTFSLRAVRELAQSSSNGMAQS